MVYADTESQALAVRIAQLKMLVQRGGTACKQPRPLTQEEIFSGVVCGRKLTQWEVSNAKLAVAIVWSAAQLQEQERILFDLRQQLTERREVICIHIRK